MLEPTHKKKVSFIWLAVMVISFLTMLVSFAFILLVGSSNPISESVTWLAGISLVGVLLSLGIIIFKSNKQIPKDDFSRAHKILAGTGVKGNAVAETSKGGKREEQATISGQRTSQPLVGTPANPVPQEVFEEHFTAEAGASPVEVEAPDLERYYDSVELENERRKKEFYVESVRSEGVKVSTSAPASPMPTIRYEPTEDDYARLQRLVAGRTDIPPVRGGDGLGANPSHPEVTVPTVKAGHVAGSPKGSSPNRLPAPHQTVETIDFSVAGASGEYQGAKYYDQFFDDPDSSKVIPKIGYLFPAALEKFNNQRRQQLNPTKPILGVNIKIKKDEKSKLQSRLGESQSEDDRRLREKIDRLRVEQKR